MTKRSDEPPGDAPAEVRAETPVEGSSPARSAPYVLQVKLQPDERSAVERAARASDLPTSTWARRELLQRASEPRSEVRQEVSLASGGSLRLTAAGMDRASPGDRAFVLQLVGSMLAYGHGPEDVAEPRVASVEGVTRGEERGPT